MTKHKSHANSIIAGEAADWFIAMREEHVSDQRREQFASWLMASPVHVEEYLGIAELWGDLEAIDLAGELIEIEPSWEKEKVVPINIDNEQITVPTTVQVSYWGNRRLTALGGICALSILWFVMFSAWQEPAINAQHYRSLLGQQRTVTLADNSIVRMNTLTELTVEYSDKQRRINLIAGEAMFDVQADAARPFVVTSGPAHIAVTGTEFNVYKQRLRTVVTVIEGAVDVAARDWHNLDLSKEPEWPLSQKRLTAMEQGVVSVTDDTVTRNQLENLRTATAWLEQQLYFEAETLANTVAEFNRYNADQLYLADAELSELRITASFNSTDPEAFLMFLERTANVTITSSPDGTRIIDVPHNNPTQD